MLDIHGLMRSLSQSRPLFHSEADFQHSLAWLIHEQTPEHDVRLEYPSELPDKRIYLDIWVPSPSIAIELKYCTRSLKASQNGEKFKLLHQRAQDTRKYDFLKDIQRLEQLHKSHTECKSGYAIFLTNEPLFWEPPRRSGTVDADFHLYEGRQVKGTMAWSAHASKGTMRGREDPIHLSGAYTAHWQDYSDVQTARGGKFRYLVVAVQ